MAEQELVGSQVDWNKYTTFERHEKLDLNKVGNEHTVKFTDEGKFVSEKTLRDAGAKFARDSIVFTVQKGNDKFEFWVSTTAYSTMGQLNKLKIANSGDLVGVRATIKRVSDNPKETNYEIKSA